MRYLHKRNINSNFKLRSTNFDQNTKIIQKCNKMWPTQDTKKNRTQLAVTEDQGQKREALVSRALNSKFQLI